MSNILTIESGEAESNALDVLEFMDQGRKPAGFYAPAAWTDASLAILFSEDDVTYYPLCDAAERQYIVNFIAGSHTSLDPLPLLNARFIKLQSVTKTPAASVQIGTIYDPVVQAADRVFNITMRA